MSKIQFIRVSAFIYYDEMVLIVKRVDTSKSLPGYYELPGGKVKFGDKPKETLAKKIKEKTGLKVKLINPYSAFSHMSSSSKEQTIDIQYTAIMMSDEINVTLSDSHDEFRWISEDDLSKITNITDKTKNAIKDGFGAING